MFADALLTDLHRSFRSIIRNPGMSLLVVMTLGLAMGANLAVFALLDKLILRPLPVERPGELVIVSAPPIQMAGTSVSVGGRGAGGKIVMGISYPLYAELRSRVSVFKEMAAQYHVRSSMLAGTETIQAKGVLVTGNYFELLGVKAFLGRTLTPGVSSAPDYRAGAAAIGLAWITGLGIWAASALRATRRSTLPALMENAGIGGHPRALHWRRGMVISQIALSLVLLCAAGVLSRSLMKLMAVDPGFPTDGLFSFALHPGQAGYEDALVSVAKLIVQPAAPSGSKSNVGTGFSPCIEVYNQETVDSVSVISLFLRRCVDRSPDLSFRHTGHGLKPART